MSKQCQLTGKKSAKGYKYTIRGISKKKKGIGLNITGKTSRRFQPNLKTKRFWYPEENRFVTLKLSSAAIRTIDKNGIADAIKTIRAQGEKV